jgi:hypothetical protein
MTEPIDPTLEALYRADRARPPLAPPGARERVLEGVLSRIGGGGGSSDPSGPVGPPSGGLGRPALAGVTFTAGLIVGGALGVLFAPRDVGPERAASDTTQTREDATHTEPVVEAAMPAEDREHHEPAAPARRRAAPIEVVPDPSTELRTGASTAEERALIDRARSALRRGDTHEALVTLMGHERRFPNGALVEERERLIVEALVAAGRIEQARARIDAYVRDHPSGIHRAALERVAAGLPR